MLAMRLQRIGGRGRPAHRIVVQDSRLSPKSGRVIEILGSYSPHLDHISVNAERAKHWIGNGAQVSGTVHNILIDQGVIKGSKKNVLPKKKPIITESAEEEKTKEAPTEKAEDTDTEAEAVKETGDADPKTEDAKQEEEKVEEKEPAQEEEKQEEEKTDTSSEKEENKEEAEKESDEEKK